MRLQDVIVAPSILLADFGHLQQDIESIEPYADWIQADIMDGHFVPNLSFGAPVLKCIKTTLPIDVHLMVENPQDRLKEFLELGVYNITFHAEAVKGKTKRKELIKAIHDGGAKAGIGINPETELDDVLDILPDVDMLLVMSVHPGFGGQEFIEHVLKKVIKAREQFPDLMIQMDGGINEDTGPRCVIAGANNLVAGSFVFQASDKKRAIELLRGS